MRRRRNSRRFLLVFALLGLLLTTACTSSGGFYTPGSHAKSSKALAPLRLSIAGPAAGATGVSVATEFPITTSGTVTSASLVASDGTRISGSFARGDRTWIPDTQLSYRTKYRLEVSAEQGRISKGRTLNFTTGGRGRTESSELYAPDGQTVGVGMPVVVKFGVSVPPSRRAAVERRLFVTAQPATEGAWHWYSGSEVHYRPKEYWKPGTKVSVRLGTGGLELAHNRFGYSDRLASFTIGSQVITKVDNASHTASVYKDGELIKQLPVSLGKPEAPTSSGIHVVLEKSADKIFDSETFGLSHADGGYKLKVYWDVRFTWGGEFVHAAPWSTADQGKRNVSHGCVNLSTENAQWFYDLSTVGDLVEVVGTETKVTPGDGWTDWNFNWDEFKAGGALNGSAAP
ncbi:MAG: hypothetical protein DLM55_04455 [Acidimicrobiales bacterium]|nr:MAG: hypothetical protein DLM55_04455 [Acidimicrobiales bacterium]